MSRETMTTLDAKPEPKLSPGDPALKALNDIAEILEPFDRTQQLRIFVGVCSLLGDYEYVERFLAILRQERRR